MMIEQAGSAGEGIAIITVHHARPDCTLRLVDSVAPQLRRAGPFELIVADNSGGCDKLRLPQQFPIRVLRVENEGYFRSANKALNVLYHTDLRYCVICNNDVAFSESFVSVLSSRKYPDDAMVIYPRLTSADGEEQNPRVERRIAWLRLHLYSLYYMNFYLASAMDLAHRCGQWWRSWISNDKSKELEPGETRPILLGCGACFILTRHYLRRCRRLPEEVFLFGEEALLTEQVFRAGGQVLFDPTLHVKHDEHSTVSGLSRRDYWEIRRGSSRVFLGALRRLADW